MKILEFTQNTPEWLEMRRTKIGGSDAPIIMKESPFQTPLGLWEQKVLGKKGFVSKAMQDGTDREEEARKFCNSLYSKTFRPVVVQSETHDWQIASLDGLDESNEMLIEIKCPGEDTFRKALAGQFPKYYEWQVQHQMLVSGLDRAMIFIYNHSSIPDLPKYVDFLVLKDDVMGKVLLAEELSFYQSMLDFCPPSPLEPDMIERDDADWLEAADSWIKARNALKEAEELESACRDALIHLAQEESARGCGVSLCRSVRRGAIEYSKIPELKLIDTEKYRKPPSVSWRLSTT
jgi:putative phage-type endonuclease